MSQAHLGLAVQGTDQRIESSRIMKDNIRLKLPPSDNASFIEVSYELDRAWEGFRMIRDINRI